MGPSELSELHSLSTIVAVEDRLDATGPLLSWTRPDSNRRPTRCKRVALPTELQVRGLDGRPGRHYQRTPEATDRRRTPDATGRVALQRLRVETRIPLQCSPMDAAEVACMPAVAAASSISEVGTSPAVRALGVSTQMTPASSRLD